MRLFLYSAINSGLILRMFTDECTKGVLTFQRLENNFGTQIKLTFQRYSFHTAQYKSPALGSM